MFPKCAATEKAVTPTSSAVWPAAGWPDGAEPKRRFQKSTQKVNFFNPLLRPGPLTRHFHVSEMCGDPTEKTATPVSSAAWPAAGWLIREKYAACAFSM
jgi:hypothetical protein